MELMRVPLLLAGFEGKPNGYLPFGGLVMSNETHHEAKQFVLYSMMMKVDRDLEHKKSSLSKPSCQLSRLLDNVG